MPQQINLYSPIFLVPRRHFSARAMLQSLTVFAVALLALCAWAAWGSFTLRRELADVLARGTQERAQLVAALAAQPASSPAPVALNQEMARVQAELAQRQRALAEVEQGLATPQASHAARLRLLARTVPPQAWLTELKLADGRLELAGLTQQPEVLRPWIERLAQEPLSAGLPLAALKIERAGPEGWRFTIVGATREPAEAGR